MTDPPIYIPAPRHLVLAFMAGLSQAAGFSAVLYVDALVTLLVERAMGGGG